MHKSFWPRNRMSIPGTAAIASIFLMQSAVSTCSATMVFSPARSMARRADPMGDEAAELTPYFGCIEKELTPDQQRQLSEEISTLQQPDSNPRSPLPEKTPIARLVP